MKISKNNVYMFMLSGADAYFDKGVLKKLIFPCPVSLRELQIDYGHGAFQVHNISPERI